MNKLFILFFLAFIMTIINNIAFSADQQNSPTKDNVKDTIPIKDIAEKYFEEGRTLFYKGNFEDAAGKFKSAIQSDKEKLIYQFFLAKSYIANHQESEGEGILVNIIKINSEHVEASLELSLLYKKDKKWKEIIQVLEPLLEIKHDYMMFHVAAEAYYNLNDSKQARKYFEKAVSLNPNSGIDYYFLGIIYLEDKKFSLAEEAYSKCLSLGLENNIVHFHLATVYFNLRNYLGRVQKVNLPDAKVMEVYKNMFIISNVKDEKDWYYTAPENSALYHVKQAMKMGLNTPTILFLEANIWLNAGYFKEAYELYLKLESIMTENKALLYYYLSEACFGLKKYDDYISNFKKAVEINNEIYGNQLASSYLRLARHYQTEREYDKYIQNLLLAIEVNPNDPNYHYLIAMAYYDKGDYNNAQIQFKMTLDLQEDHPNKIDIFNKLQEINRKAKEDKKE